MQVDERAEPFRAALDKAMQSYVKDHYPNGVVIVSFISASVNSKKLLNKFRYMVKLQEMAYN